MSNSNPVLLGVNIDHIATIRQARGVNYPDPVHAAYIAEQAGADGITVHLREDRRHIIDRDITILNETIQTRMNLEMAVTDEMLAIAEKVQPAHCCLVPERREEVTTEGGLDVVKNFANIREACLRLAEAGIRVSLFIDPDPEQIIASYECGAPDIEIHTGAYANSSGTTQAKHLEQLMSATNLALENKLTVNAGHGLHYHNVQPVAAIPGINELNIGHAIVARAVFSGLATAVSDMSLLFANLCQ